MFNYWKQITSLFAFVALAGSVSATLESGDWDLDFSGSYTSLDAAGSDIDLILASVSAGYFATGSLEIEGGFTYLDAEIAGEDLTAWLIEGGINFFFTQEGDWHPYVGGGLFLADIEVGGVGDDDDWGWEIRAGIKQFITENVTIDYEIGYMDFNDLDLDGFMVGVGLGYHF